MVLEVYALSSVAEYFLLATAASSPQLSAIVDEIERQLRPLGERVWHVEGLETPSGAPVQEAFRWVLVDCGDLVVHLFTPAARSFYQLERLWGDAPRIPLEQTAAQ